MADSYAEWQAYDPDDEQYLSTAEVIGKRLSSGWGHTKRWGKSVGEDFAWGAPLFATGHLLSKVPVGPVRGAGNIAKWLGATQMQWAPISATRQTLDDMYPQQEPPQTDAQHLKKWMKNTGTGAAIGLGTAGAGKVISLLPIPGAQIVGPAMIATGLAATKFAPVEASAELWIDKLFRNGKPRPTQPPAQKMNLADLKPYLYGSGVTGAAGLAAATALTGMMPAVRRRKALRLALILAAAAGAGYWGWKETGNAMNLNRVA